MHFHSAQVDVSSRGSHPAPCRVLQGTGQVGGCCARPPAFGSAWEPTRRRPPSHTCVALRLQVDGKKFSSVEDGIQVVVLDGSHGRVVNHTSFRNAILQGIPWQLFNYVAAIPDR